MKSKTRAARIAIRNQRPIARYLDDPLEYMELVDEMYAAVERDAVNDYRRRLVLARKVRGAA